MNTSQTPYDPPSDEFQQAVCFGGNSTSKFCELCGRLHFATGPAIGDYEGGELEMLRAQAAKDSGKWIAHPEDDSIGWGMIDGKQVVFGCPCNGLSRYEAWIWEHREIIVRYLRDRTIRDLKNARREADKAEELNVLSDPALMGKSNAQT